MNCYREREESAAACGNICVKTPVVPTSDCGKVPSVVAAAIRHVAAAGTKFTDGKDKLPSSDVVPSRDPSRCVSLASDIGRCVNFEASASTAREL